VARTLLTHLNYALPLGQAQPLVSSIGVWNYDGNAYVFNYEREHLNKIKLFPLYSLAMIVLSGGVGYVIFRRRDLK
jgi:hypothetical protein